jgi:transcriptional regulator with XRE-family HTH domain
LREARKRAGVPHSTVGRIESGGRVPSTELLARISKA